MVYDLTAIDRGLLTVQGRNEKLQIRYNDIGRSTAFSRTIGHAELRS
jgi:hypothetical protein